MLKDMEVERKHRDYSFAALVWFLSVLAMLFIWIVNTRHIPIVDDGIHIILYSPYSVHFPFILSVLLGFSFGIVRMAIACIPSFLLYKLLKPHWNALQVYRKALILILLSVMTVLFLAYGLRESSNSFIYTFLPLYPDYIYLTYSDQMGIGTIRNLEAYGFIFVTICWIFGLICLFRWTVSQLKK